MSTKIVAVLASPQPSGSTSSAVAGVLEGVVDAGGEVETIDLSATDPRDAVPAIAGAQGVVLGSPVYRASHTSLLGALLEQLERGAPGDTSAPLLGKAVSIVLTGAVHHHFLATEHLRATLASFFAAQTLSPALYLTRQDFTDDKQLTAEARELAGLHGRALVELATAVAGGPALRALRPLL